MRPSNQQTPDLYATIERHDAKPGQHNDPQQFATMETDAGVLRKSLLHEDGIFDAQVIDPKKHEDLDKVCQRCGQKPPFVGSLKAGGPVFATTCVHQSCAECWWPLKELIDLQCIHDPCSDVLGARTICSSQCGYINECENRYFWNGRQISAWPSDHIRIICLEESLCHDGDLDGLAELRESFAEGNTTTLRAQIIDFRKGLFDAEGFSQASDYKSLAQKIVSDAQAKDDPSASETGTKHPAQQSLLKRATNSFIIVNGTTALTSYVVATTASHGTLWASNKGWIAHCHSSETSRYDWAASTLGLAFLVQMLVNLKLLWRASHVVNELCCMTSQRLLDGIISLGVWSVGALLRVTEWLVETLP